MPLIGPTGRDTISYGGLTWSVRGNAGQAFMRIRLLNQGKYARYLRDYPQLKEWIIRQGFAQLRVRSPVDTGHLKRSTRIERDQHGPHLRQGPSPWYETLKSGGKSKHANKYYARWANIRSRKPGYIEGTVRFLSQLALKAILDAKRAEREEAKARVTLNRLDALFQTGRISATGAGGQNARNILGGFTEAAVKFGNRTPTGAASLRTRYR